VLRVLREIRVKVCHVCFAISFFLCFASSISSLTVKLMNLYLADFSLL